MTLLASVFNALPSTLEAKSVTRLFSITNRASCGSVSIIFANSPRTTSALSFNPSIGLLPSIFGASINDNSCAETVFLYDSKCDGSYISVNGARFNAASAPGINASVFFDILGREFLTAFYRSDQSNRGNEPLVALSIPKNLSCLPRRIVHSVCCSKTNDSSFAGLYSGNEP